MDWSLSMSYGFEYNLWIGVLSMSYGFEYELWL